MTQFMTSVKEKDRKKRPWPFIISLLMIAAVWSAYFLLPGFRDFIREAYGVLTSNNQARISNWVAQFGLWGPLMILVVMVAQMFLFVIPSILVMIVTILAYGPVWGSVITVTGILIVSSLGYAVGAYLGPRIVRKLVDETSEKKMGRFVQDYGIWAVIIARINPFFSNDATSFVAGLLRMGYWRFIGGTFTGILPLTIGIAVLGENIESLKAALLWVSLVSVAGLGVYIAVDARRKRKRQVNGG